MTCSSATAPHARTLRHLLQAQGRPARVLNSVHVAAAVVRGAARVARLLEAWLLQIHVNRLGVVKRLAPRQGARGNLGDDAVEPLASLLGRL